MIGPPMAYHGGPPRLAGRIAALLSAHADYVESFAEPPAFKRSWVLRGLRRTTTPGRSAAHWSFSRTLPDEATKKGAHDG
jgi:hypothetical protein